MQNTLWTTLDSEAFFETFPGLVFFLLTTITSLSDL